MPKNNLAGKFLDYKKVDADWWGTISPPDPNRFALPDSVYLDIGRPGRCVRNLYVQNIYDCDGNPWAAASGVGEHTLVSTAHTDVIGSPSTGQVLQYNGLNWTPVTLDLGSVGSQFFHSVPSGVISGVAVSGNIPYNLDINTSGVTNTSGRWELPQGLYSLNATVAANFNSPSGYVVAQWYNVNADSFVGTPLKVSPHSTSGTNAPIAVAITALSTARSFELRVLDHDGLSGILVSGTQAWGYTIGGRDGAQGPTGPQGPQGPPGSGGGGGATYWSGLLDVANKVWTSGQSVRFDGTLFQPIDFDTLYMPSGTDFVPPTRALGAGDGLTGGGTLAADRTFNVGAGYGITVNVDDVAVDTSVLDTLYQASGVGVGVVDGEHHLKYLGSGLTKVVEARQQILTAFDYSIDEGASLFLEDDAEVVVINDNFDALSLSGLSDVKNDGWASGVLAAYNGETWIPYSISGNILSGIQDLIDTDINLLASGNRLVYNGTSWINEPAGAGDALNVAEGDARYLKLTADNDPLTGTLTISGDLVINGTVQQTEGLIAAYRAVSATTTLATSDQYVVASGTAEIVLDLPTAPEGQVLTIKRTGLFDVHVSGAGALIDGLDVQTIEFQWSAMKLISDGTNWFIL